jgi:hypothetical protein
LKDIDAGMSATYDTISNWHVTDAQFYATLLASETFAFYRFRESMARWDALSVKQEPAA